MSARAVLTPLLWPASRLAEAFDALARKSDLAPRAVAPPPTPSTIAKGTIAEVDAWLGAVASWLGVEAEHVGVTYTDLRLAVGRLGPALIRAPDGEGYLVLLPGSRRTARVLAPDLAVRRISAETVRAYVAGPLEESMDPTLVEVIDATGIPPRRRARALQAMRDEYLSKAMTQGIWLARRDPGNGFLRQIRDEGLVGAGVRMLFAHGASYALGLGAWAMLGRGVLQGTFDPGWLAAWVLLLVTAIPFRLLSLWSEGRLALGFGRLLKQRLLSGALRLTPEEIRHEGSGELLGRVLESESVEALAMTGGFATIIALVELAFVSFVLMRGAAGLLHALLLIVWVGLTAIAARRMYVRRRTWTYARLENTRELVERMVGHRTRLAQQTPAMWHEGEDALLESYVGASRAMDSTMLVVSAVLARGWLVAGLLALTPSFLDGSATSEVIAIGLGGVLLADRALSKLAGGVSAIADAGLAWRVVGPLFKAAARAELPGVPGLTSSAPDAPLLEARDLLFRHERRQEPVLKGCTLSIHRGDKILLEGPSGGGKSTLASLLTGLRAPTAGLLLLHGLDRRSLGPEAWRKLVVSAPQFHENHILTGPFAFNLLMGDRWPGSPEDIETADAVCRELGLGELLDRMPGGMQQMVGETGWQLSHGERSRLFLARAILQRAELIVLDESFAALDPENLARALACATARAPTLMVIAHP